VDVGLLEVAAGQVEVAAGQVEVAAGQVERHHELALGGRPGIMSTRTVPAPAS
jgi:hypothetical protein